MNRANLVLVLALVLVLVLVPVACGDSDAGSQRDTAREIDAPASSDADASIVDILPDTGPDSLADVPPPSDVVADAPDTATDSDDSDVSDISDVAADVDPDSCQGICAARADDSGFCVQDGYFSASACTAYCDAQQPTWDGVAASAFDTCATQDPLCFQTIHQCMMFGIYEAVLQSQGLVSQLIGVFAADFDAHAGKTLRVNVRRGFGPDKLSSQAIVSPTGIVSVSWERLDTLPNQGVWSARAYLDVDGDSQCEPDDDLIFSGDAIPAFGTNPLEFRLILSAAETAEPFVTASICADF